MGDSFDPHILRIKSAVDNILSDDTLTSKFQAPPDTSNEQAAQLANLNSSIARRLISSIAKSQIERAYNQSKEDILLNIASIYPTLKILPGAEFVTVHQDNVFMLQYTSKRGARRLDANRLKIELIKEGVDPAIIDSCVERATKTDSPSTLFHILVP